METKAKHYWSYRSPDPNVHKNCSTATFYRLEIDSRHPTNSICALKPDKGLQNKTRTTRSYRDRLTGRVWFLLRRWRHAVKWEVHLHRCSQDPISVHVPSHCLHQQFSSSINVIIRIILRCCIAAQQTRHWINDLELTGSLPGHYAVFIDPRQVVHMCMVC